MKKRYSVILLLLIAGALIIGRGEQASTAKITELNSLKDNKHRVHSKKTLVSGQRDRLNRVLDREKVKNVSYRNFKKKVATQYDSKKSLSPQARSFNKELAKQKEIMLKMYQLAKEEAFQHRNKQNKNNSFVEEHIMQ